MPVKTIVTYFGSFENRDVNQYTITQADGIEVSIINYGATITSILVPGLNAEPVDVVLGFETLDGFLQAGDYYFNGICGRYANRIADGKFNLAGKEFQLNPNDGLNSLHGGKRGFDKVFWDAEILPADDGIKLSYFSRDGEEGFPGNLKVNVIYRVTDNELHIDFTAITDKPTPVNLTSHCYFNLSGMNEENILNHELIIYADQFVEVQNELIPTGKLMDVKNTAFDFSNLAEINKLMEENQDFDNTWVIKIQDQTLKKAATLLCRKTNIEMNVFTTQPGIHFYSGHFLENNLTDTKYERNYGKYAGLCLETQHFPDSPNHENFPDTILQPGETYHQQTIYSFKQHPII